MFSLGSPSSTRLIPALSEQNERKVSCPVLPEGWCNYMLLSIDGSYYVGLTNDLTQRIQDHSSGKGPTYTKTTKPKLLVWYESHPIRETAASREKQLKGWNRTKKHLLARARLHPSPAPSSECVSLRLP